MQRTDYAVSRKMRWYVNVVCLLPQCSIKLNNRRDTSKYQFMNLAEKVFKKSCSLLFLTPPTTKVCCFFPCMNMFSRNNTCLRFYQGLHTLKITETKLGSGGVYVFFK